MKTEGGKADFTTHFHVFPGDTHIVVLVEVGLFNFLPLKRRAVRQDVDDGLLVGSWREHRNRFSETTNNTRNTILDR